VDAAVGTCFVQFLHRLWQLLYMSASPRGCMVTASSALRIIAEWRWSARLPGPWTFRSGRRSPCAARDGQDVMGTGSSSNSICVDVAVLFQTCRSLTWSVRCSRRVCAVSCTVTADHGNSGHCAKLDKQITVAQAVLAHSSGARYVAATVKVS